jgi:hypothetical protein
VTRISTRVALVCALASVALMVSTVPASAHESRKVGPYEFVVGWYDEPVYTGGKNGPEVFISDFQSGEPITEKVPVELEVEVIFEDESTAVTMEPAFDDPSHFEAHVAPTRPGEYTFHVTGTVGDTEIDEEFTSGPETFNSPVELKEIQFPVQDPSTADLAERMDQELPRVQEEAVAAAEDAAESASDTARTVAFIALGLGVIAVLLSLFAVMRFGRSRASAPTPARSGSKG